jgi:ankyrin repeat protein
MSNVNDDMKEYFGTNLLHIAVGNGNLKKVKEYIESGADVTAVNENGDTALDIALQFKEWDILECLWEAWNKNEFVKYELTRSTLQDMGGFNL